MLVSYGNALIVELLPLKFDFTSDFSLAVQEKLKKNIDKCIVYKKEAGANLILSEATVINGVIETSFELPKGTHVLNMGCYGPSKTNPITSELIPGALSFASEEQSFLFTPGVRAVLDFSLRPKRYKEIKYFFDSEDIFSGQEIVLVLRDKTEITKIVNSDKSIDVIIEDHNPIDVVKSSTGVNIGLILYDLDQLLFSLYSQSSITVSLYDIPADGLINMSESLKDYLLASSGLLIDRPEGEKIYSVLGLENGTYTISVIDTITGLTVQVPGAHSLEGSSLFFNDINTNEMFVSSGILVFSIDFSNFTGNPVRVLLKKLEEI